MQPRRKTIHQNEPPAGFSYLPGFITDDEEQKLLKNIVKLPFKQYQHRGRSLDREVVWFGNVGNREGLDAHAIVQPFPDWLTPFRRRFAQLSTFNEEDIVMAMIGRYSIRAGLGWHKDRPQYGPTVFGLSLASDAEMKFRLATNEQTSIYKINLERCSAYVISGESRSLWQHGMQPVMQQRYSITMRTLTKNHQ